MLFVINKINHLQDPWETEYDIILENVLKGKEIIPFIKEKLNILVSYFQSNWQNNFQGYQIYSVKNGVLSEILNTLELSSSHNFIKKGLCELKIIGELLYQLYDETEITTEYTKVKDKANMVVNHIIKVFEKMTDSE